MSKEKLKPEGKCFFCGKTFSKAGINRHLQMHLESKISENKKGNNLSNL